MELIKAYTEIDQDRCTHVWEHIANYWTPEGIIVEWQCEVCLKVVEDEE